MRRVGVSIFIALILLGTVLVSFAHPVQALQDGDYIYTISGNPAVAKISSYVGTGGDITLPDTLGGYPVVAIGHDAFNSAPGYHVTFVTIPNSYQTIENYAFANCDLLMGVYIGMGTTSIGQDVFYGCDGLQSIFVIGTNPSYATINGILYNKNMTTLIKCPSAHVGEVVIPDTVNNIEWHAFDGCSVMTELEIGAGLTTIDSYMFERCYGLESVFFAQGGDLVSIGDFAFSQCTSLRTLDLPEGLEFIGNQSFQFCALDHLYIPQSVTYIGGSAFRECEGLTNVTIPANVTSMGQLPFGGCYNLTAIDVDAGNQAYASADGVLFNEAMTTLLYCPGAKAGNYTILSGVTSIGIGAFFFCTALESITMSDDVEAIGYGAFAHCEGLVSIRLSDKVTYIATMTFAYCSKLKTIVIPAGVTDIGASAFGACHSLTNITFLGEVSPANVSSDWIVDTPTTLRGHAYASSNFPVPGSTYYGLTMGSNIPEPVEESGDDYTVLMLVVIICVLALVIIALLFRAKKNEGKK